MKYVCMEDIENLAAQGKKELILEDNTVLMDLARDMARQLGISIVVGASSAPITPVPVSFGNAASPVAPSSPAKTAAPAPSSQVAPAPSSQAAPVPSLRAALPTLGARPKGCQHGPIKDTPRPERITSHQDSDGVVDQLIDLVRQSTGKQSGN